jgi:hypothetical protein
MRSHVGASPAHGRERDLIETFVERSRCHCGATAETFGVNEFGCAPLAKASTTWTLGHERC